MQRRKFLLPQLWGREPETQAWTGPRALPGLWGTVPLLLQLAATLPPPAAAFPRPLHASVCPSLPLGSVPPYSRKMSSQNPSSTISSPSGPSPRRGRAELPGGQIFGGHHPVLVVLIRTPRQPARGPRRSLSRTVRSPARCPPAPSADTTHSGFAPAAHRPPPQDLFCSSGQGTRRLDARPSPTGVTPPSAGPRPAPTPLRALVRLGTRRRMRTLRLKFGLAVRGGPAASPGCHPQGAARLRGGGARLPKRL